MAEKGQTPENGEIIKREVEFIKQHHLDTDEEILEYLRSVAKKLGKAPNKHDVVGYYYIKKRFGPWPRVLEKAGLKEVSQNQREKRGRREAARKCNKKKQCK